MEAGHVRAAEGATLWRQGGAENDKVGANAELGEVAGRHGGSEGAEAEDAADSAVVHELGADASHVRVARVCRGYKDGRRGRVAGSEKGDAKEFSALV